MAPFMREGVWQIMPDCQRHATLAARDLITCHPMIGTPKQFGLCSRWIFGVIREMPVVLSLHGMRVA